MIDIFINKKKYKTLSNYNILKACLSLGFNIPYFCWHPSIGSVGSCRQCIVKIYKNFDDKLGKFVISCITPLKKNLIISTVEKCILKNRKNISELIMLNHPHDCPICVEAGNCHLQDMIVMNKLNKRRYKYEKKVYTSQYLGPFITHNINRCIKCYRCIRYYKNYSGGKDFGVYSSSNEVYFGRYKDGKLENEFSGNLVEICPTGVFSDKLHEKNFYRKWDLSFSSSICHSCCIGCNVILGCKFNKISRVDNRYNKYINKYFICDLGRFGNEHLNKISRPKYPIFNKKKKWKKLNLNETLIEINKIFKSSKSVIGIGSDRASLESNYSLIKLVGKNNFYNGISSEENLCLNRILKIIKFGNIKIPSINEIKNYDSILIIGEDIIQTSPIIGLYVRRLASKKKEKIAKIKYNIESWDSLAIENTGQNIIYPILIINNKSTKLDEISYCKYNSCINDQIILCSKILDNLKKRKYKKCFNKEILKKSEIFSEILKNSKKPLIISGISNRNLCIIELSFRIAISLKKMNKDVGIIYTLPSVNSMGLSIINKKNLVEILKKKKKIDCAIILENNLYQHYSNETIIKIFNKIKNIIILDNHISKMKYVSKLFIPSTNFMESDGTVINYEGRAQRFFKNYDLHKYNKNFLIFESWKWINFIKNFIKKNIIKGTCIREVIKKFLEDFKEFKKILNLFHESNFKKFIKKKICNGKICNICNLNLEKNYVNNIFYSSKIKSKNFKFYDKNISYLWYPEFNSSNAWIKYKNKIGNDLNFGSPGVKIIDNFCSNKNNFYKIKYNNINENSKEISWYISPHWEMFGINYISNYSRILNKCLKINYVRINTILKKILKLKNYKNVYFNFKRLGLNFNIPVIFDKNIKIGQIVVPFTGKNLIPKEYVWMKINNIKDFFIYKKL
ncbi:MAG: NADH-quinone oxidoreductase subunit NuoG [Enterobacteriaceae bacterium]